MEWIIKDKETNTKSLPVKLEWFIFGAEDLKFENGESLPLSDFKYWYKDYEIIELPEKCE